jgi:dTDP-4-dehydrorhamnose reductase
LGTRISEAFNIEIVPREQVELTDASNIALYLDKRKPDIVINAAGVTGGPGAIGIDWCEDHKEETIMGNVIAAVNLSTACAKRGIYFVHFSSGCIYKGNNHGMGFNEEDKPNFYGPQFYAKTKIDSERILKNLPGLILRLRMPIDDISHPRNLIDKLKSYPRIINIQNSMTAIPSMLSALEYMIEHKMEGVYNMTNPGTMSAEEIMLEYRMIVDPNHKFEVMSMEELNGITKGERSNCVLDTSKLCDAGVVMIDIHFAIRSCLKEYKKRLDEQLKGDS